MNIDSIHPPIYSNREGEPITYDEWVELQANDDYRVVKRTDNEQYKVITYWFGVALEDFDITPRFQTLTFKGQKLLTVNGHGDETEAYKGHESLVSKANDLLLQDTLGGVQ